MGGYLSLEGLQHFWFKVKSYIDNKLSNASNKEENKVYSTEEHIVGTWIDGRPVYERTIEYNLTSRQSANNGVSRITLFQEDTPTIEHILSYSGWAPSQHIGVSSNTINYVGEAPINGYPYNIMWHKYSSSYSKFVLDLLKFDSNGMSIGKYCITIRYLKV